MKHTYIHTPLLLLSFCTLLLFTNCNSNKKQSGNNSENDTTYVVHGKDSTATKVKVTDGDTVMEDMEENALIPVKR